MTAAFSALLYKDIPIILGMVYNIDTRKVSMIKISYVCVCVCVIERER